MQVLDRIASLHLPEFIDVHFHSDRSLLATDAVVGLLDQLPEPLKQVADRR